MTMWSHKQMSGQLWFPSRWMEMIAMDRPTSHAVDAVACSWKIGRYLMLLQFLLLVGTSSLVSSTIITTIAGLSSNYHPHTGSLARRLHLQDATAVVSDRDDRLLDNEILEEYTVPKPIKTTSTDDETLLSDYESKFHSWVIILYLSSV